MRLTEPHRTLSSINIMSSIPRTPLKLTSKLLAITGPDEVIADVSWGSDEEVPDPEAQRLEAERLRKARLLAYLQEENANRHTAGCGKVRLTVKR